MGNHKLIDGAVLLSGEVGYPLHPSVERGMIKTKLKALFEWIYSRVLSGARDDVLDLLLFTVILLGLFAFLVYPVLRR